MTPTLDALRAKFPNLAFYVVALPGQPISLECVNEDGMVFPFKGATLEAAILAGFADDFAEPAPPPAVSVFD